MNSKSHLARSCCALSMILLICLGLWTPGIAAEAPIPGTGWPALEDIGASSYIVADGDTGEIIFDYQSDIEAYPASMTKIMTALVVLDSPDFAPDKPVYFSENACAMPAPESSTAGFLPGEVAPTIACLYVMMVQSANEVANALAETYGGSVEGFVELMNEKAQALGCEHTNFVDPCGFGFTDHHTTGQDLVKIIREAMQNRIFQALVSTKEYSLPPTNMHPISGWSNNFNHNYLMVFQDAGYQSPWLRSIDGVKAGNTDLAGACLATAATTYDGRHLIAVIFNGYYQGGDTNSFVGVSIMSHTLLEEGAKRLGCPRREEVETVPQDALTYGWPTAQDPTVAETTLPTEPTEKPSYTLAPVTTLPDSAVELAEDEMVMNRWAVLALLVIVFVLLITSVTLTYQYLLRRKQDTIRKRYQSRQLKKQD